MHIGLGQVPVRQLAWCSNISSKTPCGRIDLPGPQLKHCGAATAPSSWPQQQLARHCQALPSSHMDCRHSWWRASMVRHSRGVASQHHCKAGPPGCRLLPSRTLGGVGSIAVGRCHSIVPGKGSNRSSHCPSGAPAAMTACSFMVTGRQIS